MKAIVNTGPNRLEWQDVPTPKPGPGQVRIRTAACGICATDLEMFAGWRRTGFPAVGGHEWSGTVDAVGHGVRTDWLRRACVAENVLADGGEVGFEHPGGYGEYFVTDAAKLHALPERFPLDLAVLIEPLAVAVRAMRRLRVTDRRRAIVFGDGPIGLLMLVLLRRAGVERVFMLGGRAGRLKVARELGAADVLCHRDVLTDLATAVRDVTDRPFGTAVEASGSALGIKASMELVAPGGKVAIVGAYGEERAGFAWNDVLHNELELIGSNASAGAWPEAVRLAVGGALPLHRLVTHRFPAREFAKAVDLVRGKDPDLIKAVLEWK